MSWDTILWIAAAALLFFLMVRGCGGMMARRGCGMGRRMGECQGRGETEFRPPSKRDTELKSGSGR